MLICRQPLWRQVRDRMVITNKSTRVKSAEIKPYRLFKIWHKNIGHSSEKFQHHMKSRDNNNCKWIEYQPNNARKIFRKSKKLAKRIPWLPSGNLLTILISRVQNNGRRLKQFYSWVVYAEMWHDLTSIYMGLPVYGSIFRRKWPQIKFCLLSPHKKCMY